MEFVLHIFLSEINISLFYLHVTFGKLFYKLLFVRRSACIPILDHKVIEITTSWSMYQT